WKVAVELGCARGDNDHPVPACALPDGLEQRGLADPRRVFDQHRAAATAARLLDEPVELLQLLAALEETDSPGIEHEVIVYMPRRIPAPHREKFGVPVKGAPRCGRLRARERSRA